MINNTDLDGSPAATKNVNFKRIAKVVFLEK